jgi:hypothetical protein
MILLKITSKGARLTWPQGIRDSTLSRIPRDRNEDGHEILLWPLWVPYLGPTELAVLEAHTQTFDQQHHENPAEQRQRIPGVPWAFARKPRKRRLRRYVLQSIRYGPQRVDDPNNKKVETC